MDIGIALSYYAKDSALLEVPISMCFVFPAWGMRGRYTLLPAIGREKNLKNVLSHIVPDSASLLTALRNREYNVAGRTFVSGVRNLAPFASFAVKKEQRVPLIKHHR